MADWFRRKTWIKDDESEFYSKLTRARANNRAQYLRIQAVVLLKTEQPENIEAAKSLLEKILTDYPENILDKSSTLYLLGEVFQYKGEKGNALNCYRQAVDFEAEYPNTQTNAFLSYSEMIVKGKQEEYYDFVENLISSKIATLMFPIMKYKAYSILSVIYKHKKDMEMAKYFADLAEQNATAENSGFRYHKDLGLVEKRDVDLDRLVSGK